MDSISIIEKKHESCIVLEITGPINSYTHTEFEKAVYAAVKKGHLILDLSNTVSISSFGLGILLSAFDDAAEAGSSLYILNPSKLAWLAIESTGFSDMFKIIHSLDQAECIQ